MPHPSELHKYTALWQADNPIERDWIQEIFAPWLREHVTDGKHEVVLDDCILLDAFVYCQDPAYYARFRGKNAFLVHFLDENYEGGYDVYRNFRGVFRCFWSDVFNEDFLLRMPIGYQNGMGKGPLPEPATRRKFIWSFIGQAGKSSRPDAVRALASVEPHFLFSTDEVRGFTFVSGTEDRPRRLPAADAAQILRDSMFAPCPMGNANIECYRFYEALECGAIPIVEKRLTLDYYRSLLGDHPVPTVRSWNEARHLVNRLMQHPEQMDQLQQTCVAWWRDYKVRYAERVGEFLARRSADPAPMKPLASGLAKLPGWKVLELLRHHDSRALLRRVRRQADRLIRQRRMRVAYRAGSGFGQDQ